MYMSAACANVIQPDGSRREMQIISRYTTLIRVIELGAVAQLHHDMV
jgi:hypothetical protein